MVRQYTVSIREGHWWVVDGGSRLGPYLSRQVGAAAAIALAKADFHNGIAAEVTVEETTGESTLIYGADDD